MTKRVSGLSRTEVRPPEHEVRAEIVSRLISRREEIAEATSACVESLDGTSPPVDPDYLEGLRVAVVTALEFGLASIEVDEDRPLPIPPVLISQARLAACSGVTLDVVLRRYFAGFTLFGDYVLQEAEAVITRSRPVSVHRLMQAQRVQFNRLVAIISDEYMGERERWIRSSDRRQAERVEKLLRGEMVDLASLPITFDRWHVGLVAKGARAGRVLRDAVTNLDLSLLLIKPRDEAVWCWLSTRRAPDLAEIEQALLMQSTTDLSIAIGEPGEGLRGWRTTHRQAQACIPVAVRGERRIASYKDASVIAALLKDELLMASLFRRYLHPLGAEDGDSDVSKRTLRAYLAAQRNVSSAAAALGLSRSTVNNRLRAIERRLGRPLGDCAFELEAALWLDEFGPDISAGYEPVRRSH